LSFVDFVDYDLKGLYYEILHLILQRGELDLGQVGIFTKASARHNKSVINAKKKVAVKYQYFIYDALRYCIDKLSRKSVDFYKRDFISINIGIAYFKVPEFRERFMEAIMREKLLAIPEWKNTHWSLDDNQLASPSLNKAVDHFFNWREYFYDQIPESDQKKKNVKILSNVMVMKKWEDKLAKRGSAFFQIISKWAEYARTTVVKNFNWRDIPGYGSILKAVFSEMKERSLDEYPDSLVNATSKLLANENILSVLIEIIFKKTNIHNPKQVEI